MIKQHTLRDRISFFNNPSSLRKPSFKIFDAVSTESPDIQILSLVATLEAFCMAGGLDSHELISRTKNMMKHVDGPFNKEISAIRDYASNEIFI